MSNLKCSQCGAPVEENTAHCKYCGGKLDLLPQTTAQAQPAFQQQAYQAPVNTSLAPGIDPSWPIKSKLLAAVLAILFGSLGIHKFYLGRPGMGFLYLIFCWTYIPGFIGFIEGIIYLVQKEHNFQVKNRVRIS